MSRKTRPRTFESAPARQSECNIHLPFSERYNTPFKTKNPEKHHQELGKEVTDWRNDRKDKEKINHIGVSCMPDWTALIELSEEFITVHDGKVCLAPVMADKDILELVQSSKNIYDADSVDKNEMNNVASVLTSSEIRNVMKRMSSYVDAHFNGGMNNKIDDIELVDNFMPKKKHCE
ncbi:hypothetical protein TNCV_4247841 [Trichonephila clavipes]|nr:hypothetical protein TNCV_4247841 [Trichonephila clavipes]